MPSKVRPLCKNALTVIVLRRFSTAAIVCRRSVAACMVAALFATTPVHAELIDWTSIGATSAAGTLGGATVDLSGLEPGSSIESVDLSGSDFAFAPGSGAEEVVAYSALSDWSASFSTPVDDLMLYAVFWRGFFAGADPVTYTFDQPFTIKSGLASATVFGTTLTLPGNSTAGSHSGILQFGGAISSLNIETNATGHSMQALTFGVPAATVPEPGSLVIIVAALLAMSVHRQFVFGRS